MCAEYGDDTWDDSFFAAIRGSLHFSENEEEEGEEKEQSLELQLLSPKVQLFKEAMQALQAVQHFLNSRGCTDEANQASLLIDNLAFLHTSSAKQISLLNYFQPQ